MQQLNPPLPQRFADEMGTLLGPEFPSDIGLAVSGGGDSMAMLHLAAGWARVYGVTLWAATVDHGLRSESAAEAKMVADECAGLGVAHSTLIWRGDKSGNLQNAARQARLDLLNRWRGGVQHILFAHTADDQAETFLMRLARGSGVDGLSGMKAAQTVYPQEGSVAPLNVCGAPPQTPIRRSFWDLVRPLLGITRAELRHYAGTLKIPYVDDPSNENRDFARVRMRQFLSEEGADTSRLLATQKAMARARAALEQRAIDAAQIAKRPSPAEGIVRFDRDIFAKIEEETRLRIIAKALQLVTGAPYRPRLEALERSLEEALSGKTTTLHGALIAPKNGDLFIGREFEAVKNTQTPAGPSQLWDGRLVLYGPEIKGLKVRALGADGCRQLKRCRASSIPYDLLKALPGVFDGDELVGFRPFQFGRQYIVEIRNSSN